MSNKEQADIEVSTNTERERSGGEGGVKSKACEIMHVLYSSHFPSVMVCSLQIK